MASKIVTETDNTLGSLPPLQNVRAIKLSDPLKPDRGSGAKRNTSAIAPSAWRKGDHPILLPDPHRSASSLPNFTEPPNTPPPVRRVQTMKSSSSATNVIRGIRRTVSFQMQPERPLGPPPTLLRGLANILMASWLNILLVFLPISWSLRFTVDMPPLNFTFLFLTALPLGNLIGHLTEDLRLRVKSSLGIWIATTMGNSVELISAIVAVRNCELKVVQSSLMGTMLSNLLLVLGISFTAGGTLYDHQCVNFDMAQINSSLLVLATIAIIIPAAFHFAVSGQLANAAERSAILHMSHAAAIILISLYMFYLLFHLFSHVSIYNEEDAATQTPSMPLQAHIPLRNLRSTLSPRLGSDKPEKNTPDTISSAATYVGMVTAASEGSPTEDGKSERSHGRTLRKRRTQDSQSGDMEIILPVSTGTDDEEAGQSPTPSKTHSSPQLALPAVVILLAGVVALTAVTLEWLVQSIGDITASGRISREWIGLIMLPLLSGNTAERLRSVSISVQDELNLCIKTAIGSTIQMALFISPIVMCIAWGLGRPLTFLFDPFECIALFFSVMLLNYILADGRTNWFEGMILIHLYILVAVAFWFYPGTNPADSMLQC